MYISLLGRGLNSMMHNVLAIIFILVTASFYDGIARDSSEEASLEVVGESEDEADKRVFDGHRVSFFAITGCRPEDYSYECVDKRKWYNVIDKLDTFFDHYYDKDKKMLKQYLISVIQEKIQYRHFTRWEKSIKHRFARRLIATDVVQFLRLLSNDYLKSIFIGEVKESFLKYAVRFVFYEKNQKYIDTISLIGDVHRSLVSPTNGEQTLDLSFFNNRHFQPLLMHAHELFEVFFKKEITTLCLYKCDLSLVPNFNMPSLRYLWLFKNKLKEVPNFTLPNLVLLDLVFNELESIPDFECKKLEELKLSYNKLKSIPCFDLPCLRKLTLSHNRLIKLPFLSLPSLKELDLCGNRSFDINSLALDCPKLEDIIY